METVKQVNFSRTCSLKPNRREKIISERKNACGMKLVKVSCSLSERQVQSTTEVITSQSRRSVIETAGALFLGTLCNVEVANAREKRKPKNIPEESYETASNGLKYYDFLEGNGETAENGSLVLVHFDCIYKSITVSSSRESKLLGGNRIIAQPYEFIVGSKPGIERKKDFVDSANGLFSAQAAPKPPKALYSVTEGMKVGGKRTVIVPPDEGYGNRGYGEMPAGETFELNIELLEIKKEPTTKT